MDYYTIDVTSSERNNTIMVSFTQFTGSEKYQAYIINNNPAEKLFRQCPELRYILNTYRLSQDIDYYG